MAKPGLIVICGATATGKSQLALTLAQRLNTVILTADSRQVYRGFDIGTAKPSPQEQAQVPHYLLDICHPQETLTLGDYQRQAQDLIAQVQQSGRVPLLVGGTGLYIKAIVRGLQIPRVPPQPDLRSQLSRQGQAYCYQILRQVDPVAGDRIHPQDQVRTLRALEVFYTTGQPLSAQQGEDPPSYGILQVGLGCDRAYLRQRIAQRTAAMIQQGLVEEVAHLTELYGEQLPLLQTLGYREVGQFLRGEWSLPEAEASIVRHTGQLAKRQDTWFRSVRDLEWFPIVPDPQNPTQGMMDWDALWARVQEFLASA
jgi:tRNA dimethylallyltransferase